MELKWELDNKILLFKILDYVSHQQRVSSVHGLLSLCSDGLQIKGESFKIV